MTPYTPEHATHLHKGLSNDRVWQHMSRAAPAGAATLDQIIRFNLASGYQTTFTIRQRD